MKLSKNLTIVILVSFVQKRLNLAYPPVSRVEKGLGFAQNGSTK